MPELVAAIMEYIEEHNAAPKPFVWTAKAKDVLGVTGTPYLTPECLLLPPVVAPLREMMRLPRNHDARQASHRNTLTESASDVKS